MEQNSHLSLASFSRKLRKYCTNAAECAVKEKECVSRLETIITQRDACLVHLAEQKDKHSLLCEELEDLQNQREDALEFYHNAEKRYQKYAVVLSSQTAESDGKSAAPDKMEVKVDDECPDEQLLKRFLRKYCNLYVQFNKRPNVVRVLSLEDNRYFEIDLNRSKCNDLVKIWSNIGSSSLHLSTWEELIQHQMMK
ncbi:uncharacterized protein LOC131288497 [Anopheles ziemanni]|uniref:uncharacterized protein LOC131258504 n=1 Tax=Anopheles coustani TaxID=139045 RepID=UPI00265AB330|nr:uncharacterized protein LOC131258504 [Anopheles coustani]XP_058173622.1 uncharacterized protein LOC131288497 [Anopheles ziemanni]